MDNQRENTMATVKSQGGWFTVHDIAAAMGRTWLAAVNVDLDRLARDGVIEHRFAGPVQLFRYVPRGVGNPATDPSRPDPPPPPIWEMYTARFRACPIPAFRRKPVPTPTVRIVRPPWCPKKPSAPGHAIARQIYTPGSIARQIHTRSAAAVQIHQLIPIVIKHNRGPYDPTAPMSKPARWDPPSDGICLTPGQRCQLDQKARAASGRAKRSIK